MQSRAVSEVVVISSDDDDFPASSDRALKQATSESGRAASDSRQPVQQTTSADRAKKAAKPIFLTAATVNNRAPMAKSRAVTTRAVSISSSSEDEAANPNHGDTINPLLYSPVKTSHDKDVIDLTLTSSDEEQSSDSDSDDERYVVSLLEESPPPSTAPRLKRLIKGSRFLTDPADAGPPTDGSTVLRTTEATPSDVVNSEDGHSKPRSGISKPYEFSLQAMDDLLESDEDIPTLPKPVPRPKAKPPKSKPKKLLEEDSDSDTPRSSTPQTTLAASPTKKGKTPRISKKALQAAEQSLREAYAQDLFNELNRSVFKGGLPEGTALKWSNRLLTTAGRARWRRSRDGPQTTEIELATKVLDCDERIRNTLSHEMCHLACWIIDGDPKEGHGRIFKSWAAKVSRKRPEIVVSTKHNYEINYPYEWECNNCAKVYGRYSKSIRPDECRCGTCKVGKLMPLFITRAAKSPTKTKAVNEVDAAKSDASRVVPTLIDSLLDLTLDDDPKVVAPEGQKESSSTRAVGAVEAQLEALTQDLGGIDLLSVDTCP